MGKTSTEAALKIIAAKIKELRADRKAFASETQGYRKAWVADRKEIEGLRKEVARLEGICDRLATERTAYRKTLESHKAKGEGSKHD